MKLTQASVAGFDMPAGKSDHIEFDDAMPGFGVRIRAGATGVHRTFIAQYKYRHEAPQDQSRQLAKVNPRRRSPAGKDYLWQGGRWRGSRRGKK